MPSSSAKQSRFMAAIAHNPSFAKKVGVSQSVGKDFNAADKGKTFNKGGMMKTRKFATAGFVDDSDMDDEGNTRSKYEIDPDSRRAHGLYDEKPAARPAARPATSMVAGAPKGAREMAAFRKMRTLENTLNKNTQKDNWGDEDRALIEAAKERYKYIPPVERATATRIDALQSVIDKASKKSTAEMKQGGTVKEPKGMMGKEVAFMKKKGAPASMIKHEKAEAGMGKGGMPMKDGKPAFMKKFAKGGGIESRGKTKGTVIRMASGGSVSSASRRADGIAQRGKTRC